MKSIRVALLSDDADFAGAFSKGIHSCFGNIIISFVDTGSVEEGAAESLSSQDIFLWDREPGGSELKAVLKESAAKAGRIFSELCDDVEARSGEALCETPRLYRYSDLRCAGEWLLRLYSAVGGKALAAYSGEGAGVVCITAERGGSGKSTAAIAMAQELARYKGKKVLYLNLSYFDDSEKFFLKENAAEKPFGEFLYLFLRGKAAEPSLYVGRDEYGVSRIPRCGLRNGLRELEDDDFRSLFEYLRSCGSFEYMVCDLAGDCGEKELFAMEKSKLICFADESEAMENFICFELGDEMRKRFRRLDFVRDESSVYTDGERRVVDIDGDFGNDVKLFCEANL